MSERLQLLIEEAFEAGRKVGIARKQSDESRASFHRQHFLSFVFIHRGDGARLREAYDNGYRAGRGDITEMRFR